jgi:hypothetical protein
MAQQITSNTLGNLLPDELDQLAFDKQPNEPFTKEEFSIMEEWNSGEATELMKISTNDPRLLEYMGLRDKLENKKAEVWKNV